MDILRGFFEDPEDNDELLDGANKPVIDRSEIKKSQEAVKSALDDFDKAGVKKEGPIAEDLEEIEKTFSVALEKEDTRIETNEPQAEKDPVVEVIKGEKLKVKKEKMEEVLRSLNLINKKNTNSEANDKLAKLEDAKKSLEKAEEIRKKLQDKKIA